MHWLVTIGLTNAALATLLAGVAWAIARSWRQPALAHLLWLIVLLKLLTPPLVEVPVGWKFDVTALGPQAPEPLSASPEFIAQRAVLTQEQSSVSSSTTAPTKSSDSAAQLEALAPARQKFEPSAQSATRRSPIIAIGLRPALAAAARWLPVVWLCGIGLRIILLTRRAWTFRDLIRQFGLPEPALSRRAQQLAHAAGLSAAPQVIAIDAPVSPMLWGLGSRVRLIFPYRLSNELPPSARDALLLHELAHFSRGDQWVRLLELAAEIVFWWHPVVWWARRELEAAEEQCCDAWVVERQSASRRTYAEALLATIDFLCDQPAMLPPAASGLGTVPLLRIRLTQIMRGDVAAHLPARARIAVAVIAVVILPLGPALFGASLPAPRLRQPQRNSVPPAGAKIDEVDNSKPSVGETDSSSSASNTSIPISSLALLPAAPRPPVVITATATSPNGKYRLERRKGSHVTLVSQTANWRLDMSTHGILCVAFTPDSRLFTTGHEDGLVRVWDSETGGLATTLRGGSDAIWSVAVSAGPTEGYQVAAGAKDGSVLVWDLASGEEIASLPPSASSVSCLRWSGQGDKLAISWGEFSDRDEGVLLLWSPLEKMVLARTAMGRPAAALVWLPGDARLLVADWAGDAEIWQASDSSHPLSVSLGRDAKRIVEAAHWSADCPLLPVPIADELALSAK